MDGWYGSPTMRGRGGDGETMPLFLGIGKTKRAAVSRRPHCIFILPSPYATLIDRDFA